MTEIGTAHWYRPEPPESPLTGPFWHAARDRRLVIASCDRCAHCYFPSFPACPRCGSGSWTWVPASGTGVLYAVTEVHRPPDPRFEIPYVVAIVDLDGGGTLVSNVVGNGRRHARAGMRARVAFRTTESGATLPCFELISVPDAARPRL